MVPLLPVDIKAFDLNGGKLKTDQDLGRKDSLPVANKGSSFVNF